MKNIVQASLIVTYRCNAKCSMCETWKYPTKPAEELDPKYCAKLPSGLRINISGGEPMIRDDIEEFFRILYPKSYLLELSTNGYFTDRIVRLAEKFPHILIRVSVEGLPALNDRLRGIPGGFDRALRTVLELKKTKCKNIGFSIVISPENASDLLQLYELCCSLGVELGNSVMHNSWYFHKMDNVITGDKEVSHMHIEFIKALLESQRTGIRNKLKDYGRAYFNLSILKRLRGDVPGYRPSCGAGTDFFLLTPLEM
jgi:Fe-coproporphyrin III synthase